MKAMQAGINRYIKDQRGIDVIADQRFIQANQMYQDVLKENKSARKGMIKHKKPISEEDLKELYIYFGQYTKPDPGILQMCVLFQLMYFMCRRGRENICDMTKETFEAITYKKCAH